MSGDMNGSVASAPCGLSTGDLHDLLLGPSTEFPLSE